MSDHLADVASTGFPWSCSSHSSDDNLFYIEHTFHLLTACLDGHLVWQLSQWGKIDKQGEVIAFDRQGTQQQRGRNCFKVKFSGNAFGHTDLSCVCVCVHAINAWKVCWRNLCVCVHETCSFSVYL